jgi:integrase
MTDDTPPHDSNPLEYRLLLVLVERSFSRGVLRAYGKTSTSRRRVPLSRAARDALAAVTRRIDTPLVFPSVRGDLMHLENWRPREWKPALEAAGIDHGNVYTLRHTAATTMLAAGLSLYEVSRYLGTSVVQISKTYGHLAQGSEHAAVAKLDAAAGGSGV